MERPPDSNLQFNSSSMARKNPALQSLRTSGAPGRPVAHMPKGVTTAFQLPATPPSMKEPDSPIVLNEPTPKSSTPGTVTPPPPGGVLPQGHAPSQLPAGAAIRALKVLSKAQAPVSEILVSTSLVAVRKFCEGKERAIVRAAIELNSHARSGLSADARVAMRRLHAAKLPLAYVLLAKTEGGARAVALGAQTGDKDRLAEDCELVHRDAHHGTSFMIWQVPEATQELLEAKCQALAAKASAEAFVGML